MKLDGKVVTFKARLEDYYINESEIISKISAAYFSVDVYLTLIYLWRSFSPSTWSGRAPSSAALPAGPRASGWLLALPPLLLWKCLPSDNALGNLNVGRQACAHKTLPVGLTLQPRDVIHKMKLQGKLSFFH